MKNSAENKVVVAAKAAKKNGIEYMSSIVKSHLSTTYHHYVKIDDVIRAGKWIPAPSYQFASGARGRYGVTTLNLPANSINKSDAIAKYCK